MKYALVIADTEGADLRNPLSDKVVQLLNLEGKLSSFCKEGEGSKHLAIGCYVVPLTTSTRSFEKILSAARSSDIALHVLFLDEKPLFLTSE